jgi:hypothetical protein
MISARGRNNLLKAPSPFHGGLPLSSTHMRPLQSQIAMHDNPMMQAMQNNPMMQMMQMGAMQMMQMMGNGMRPDNTGSIRLCGPSPDSAARASAESLPPPNQLPLLALADGPNACKEDGRVASAAAAGKEEQPHDGREPGDDIDAMITAGAEAHAVKATKSVAKAKKTILKKPAACVATKRPNFGDPLPMQYKGCQICESPGTYRVVPRPALSKYDRRFPFAGKTAQQKADVWIEVVKYCEKPFIPESSVNFVKM